MNSLVTIIIPVYKSEKWLSRCLESVTKQNYKELEIILINDGSPDKSGDICEKYSNLDSRIKVIHQKNQGPSVARNVGLKMAKGKYIQFVDSDDWLESNACATLVKYMESQEVDEIVCGLNVIKHEKLLRTPHLPEKKYSVHTNPEDFFELFKILASPCNKLYKKELITEYFDTKTTAGEDLRFNLDYLKNTNTVLSIPDCLYNVCLDNEQSLNRKFREDRLDVFLSNQEKVFEFCDKLYGQRYKQTFLYNKSVLGVHAYYRDVCKLMDKKDAIRIIKKYINQADIVLAVKNAKHSRGDYRIFNNLLRIRNTKLIFNFFKVKFLLEKLR